MDTKHVTKLFLILEQVMKFLLLHFPFRFVTLPPLQTPPLVLYIIIQSFFHEPIYLHITYNNPLRQNITHPIMDHKLKKLIHI